MIDPDFTFEGFEAESWARFAALFGRGAGDDRPTRRTDDGGPVPSRDARDALVVVTDADRRPLACFSRERGRIAVDGLAPLDDLEAAATRLGVARVIAVAVDSPDPTKSAVLRRAFDLALPLGRSALAVAWDRERVATAVALRRGGRGLDRVVGPETILDWAGPLSGDLRRDHRTIERAVSAALAPVHLGVFARFETFARLLRGPEPGAWARAVALREILVHPAPPYVHVAVAADGLRGTARWAGRRLGEADVARYADPLVRVARNQVSAAGQAVTNALGFDPLAAIARHFRRSG